jgi:hypothetical protein
LIGLLTSVAFVVVAILSWRKRVFWLAWGFGFAGLIGIAVGRTQWWTPWAAFLALVPMGIWWHAAREDKRQGRGGIDW